jgi:hypothetical protein
MPGGQRRIWTPSVDPILEFEIPVDEWQTFKGNVKAAGLACQVEFRWCEGEKLGIFVHGWRREEPRQIGYVASHQRDFLLSIWTTSGLCAMLEKKDPSPSVVVLHPSPEERQRLTKTPGGI